MKSKSKSLKSKVNDLVASAKKETGKNIDDVNEDKQDELEKVTRDESKKVHGRENYIEVKIPKLSAVILKLKV